MIVKITFSSNVLADLSEQWEYPRILPRDTPKLRPDHNTPTHDQDKEIEDPISKTQVDTLTKNAKDFGLTHYGLSLIPI